MNGCLQTSVRKQPIIALYFELRVRKQPIIALYFEFENELKFFNLKANFQLTSLTLESRFNVIDAKNMSCR